jgi:hypothetical protein
MGGDGFGFGFLFWKSRRRNYAGVPGGLLATDVLVQAAFPACDDYSATSYSVRPYLYSVAVVLF